MALFSVFMCGGTGYAAGASAVLLFWETAYAAPYAARSSRTIAAVEAALLSPVEGEPSSGSTTVKECSMEA